MAGNIGGSLRGFDFPGIAKYWPADLVGRAGIESLCENTLRGTRGKIETVVGTDDIVDKIDAVSGRNVPTSIDILLQQDIENDFAKTRPQTTDPTSGVVHPARFNQHGAAVVIKVDTGEVLALVSNPGFDLNDLDARYSEFAADELNRPMFDLRHRIGGGARLHRQADRRQRFHHRWDNDSDGQVSMQGRSIYRRQAAASRALLDLRSLHCKGASARSGQSSR